MFRSLFLLLFVFSTYMGVGQSLLSGVASHYVGDYVLLFRMADAVSGERIFVDKVVVSPKGEFQFKVNASECTPHYIQIGSQSAVLYVEPGKSYSFVFPAPDPNAFQRFEGTEGSLIFENADTTDVNILIRKFNARYISFLNEHYYDFALGSYGARESVVQEIRKGAKGKEQPTPAVGRDTAVFKPSVFPEVVVQFKQEMDALFAAHFDNTYFATYVEYSMSEIELLAGLGRKFYYESYFMSRPLPLLNPAFGSAFKLFYKNRFSTAAKDVQKKINVAVNVEQSSLALLEAFASDTITLSPDLRALACIYGLHEANANDALLEPMVLKTLEDFVLIRKGDAIGQIAERCALQKKRFKPGWRLDDFTLTDVKGNRWKWSEQDPKPTYFLFFATWSAASLKELALMQKLHAEFGSDVEFVAVNMDDDVELMKKYIEAHRDHRFKILSGLGDPLLTQKMFVKSIPHAVFVDEDGAIVTAYTRRPSEGARLDIEKSIATKRANSKSGIKTWKNQ